MSFDEIDLKNRIQEQAKNVEVPESLKPEAVEKRLSEINRKKRKIKPAYYIRVAAAACFVLLVGIVGGKAYDSFGPGHYDAEKMVADGGANGMTTEETSGAGNAVNRIRTAETYDDIYKYIEAEQKQRQSYKADTGFLGGLFSSGNGGVMEYAMDSGEKGATNGAAPQEIAQVVDYDSAAVMTEAGEAESSVDYSDTNTREEDVAEADIVKTDGKHLYILYGHRVEIVDIEQDKMEELGEIVLGDDLSVAEIYLQKERLIIVYTDSRPEGEGEYPTYRTYAVAETFDVSNPSKPKSIGKISQSGRYYTTRIKDGYVYLFSNYYADYEVARSYENGFVPTVEGEKITAGNVYLPMLDVARKYLVVSSFSLEEPDEVVDNKAIFGDADLCYVSAENIYVCENYYGYEGYSDGSQNDVSQTYIRKVAYKDGEMSAVGQTKLAGTVNDSFSLDEYEGNLRLVTTVQPIASQDDGIMPLWFGGARAVDDVEEETEEKKDSNSLYVLDANLNELARIEGLAEDERIYSARFMGDAGYFVTFRQMDPLFSVDLSDPKNPKILGELKIPGFSDYLHPYGNGKLLGIGMDVDEEGVTTNGVKLSMFDISNPANVTEADKYVLEGTYSTDVSYNYKAAFVDVKKNLIGFNAYGDGAHYYIFSYGENGFECKFDRELIGVSSDVRALYAGERLYLVAGNTVVSYRLKTFEKIDDIVLGSSGRSLPEPETNGSVEVPDIDNPVEVPEVSGYIELDGE